MDNNKLKELSIGYNNITDSACDIIATMLGRNNCLTELIMWGNHNSSKTIQSILKALEGNGTLILLGLPFCPEALNNLKHEVVNKMRESRSQTKLEIYYL